eukprot:Phypoly_transcript_15502.p1 GENE.Phypoly_transcript_15502~~Phypoly_transcript_15502.p1  ORF type:complete len:287 (+),score=53.04 Phypoly_transcript_15502:22-882(+)
MGRKKVGITGAGGRIGGILAAALTADYDLRLFVFDNPINKDSQCQTVSIPSSVVLAGLTEGEGLEIVRGVDLSDAEAVKGKFTGLDYVIHLAANADPWEAWKVLRAANFDSTVNVFEESVRAKVKRVIFASSNHTQHGLSAKGPNDVEALDENKVKVPFSLTDTPYPDSMYAISKLFGEELGRLYAWKHGLESIAMRIGWIKDFEKDNPSDLKGANSESYMRAIYLSHRDCIGFFKAALSCEIKNEHGIPYQACYVCSNNTKKFWNMNDITALGYTPVDDAEHFFA